MPVALPHDERTHTGKLLLEKNSKRTARSLKGSALTRNNRNGWRRELDLRCPPGLMPTRPRSQQVQRDSKRLKKTLWTPKSLFRPHQPNILLKASPFPPAASHRQPTALSKWVVIISQTLSLWRLRRGSNESTFALPPNYAIKTRSKSQPVFSSCRKGDAAR